MEKGIIPWVKSLNIYKKTLCFQIYFKFNAVPTKIFKEAFSFTAGSSMKSLKQDNLTADIKKKKTQKLV